MDHTGITATAWRSPQRLRAWFELLRPPNLFTVPGDPLAGYALALAATGAVPPWSPRLALILLPSLLLYTAGLIQNDLCDLAADRRERPRRPLPSARVRPAHARAAVVVLVIGGLALAAATGLLALLTALALAATIALYNARAKHHPFAGPLTMGACRGLSLLLGAAAAGLSGLQTMPVPVAALGLTLVVASISVIATHETMPFSGGYRRWLPAVAVLAWLAGMAACGGLAGNPNRLPLLAFSAGAAIIHTLRCARVLRPNAPPAVVQRTVGALIRGLLPVQAALVVGHGAVGLGAALVLLAAWPAARASARRFYAS